MTNNYDTLIRETDEAINLDISLLDPSPLNTFEANDLDDLVNSIRVFRIITPLTVVGPNENGRYEILAGERRYRASVLLNKELPGFLPELPCYVIGDSDMPKIIKQLVIEESNLETREDYNKDTHRFQLIKLYKQLADEGSIKEKEIIKRLQGALKLSRRYSVMYLTIFRKGVPELQESVKSEQKKPDGSGKPVHIPVSAAAQIATMEEEKQREAIDRANKGENAEEIVREMKRPSFEEMPNPAQPSPVPAPRKQVSAPAPVYRGDFDDDMGLDDEDDIGMLDEMEEDDDDMDEKFDPSKYMDDSNRVNLEYDTTSSIRHLKNTSSNSSVLADERRAVSGWLRYIKKKLSAREILDDEDAALIDQFSEVLELYNEGA